MSEKVLFYPLVNLDAIPFNRIYCDYQLDCLFHGLRSLLGEDCIDAIKFPIWYDTVNKSELYGNGFTVYGLLPDITIDREDIQRKIETKYFDQIIVGVHNNMYNNPKNAEIVRNLVSYGNRVKVVCGNDLPGIDLGISDVCPFFKRELTLKDRIKNVYPISFCIPKEKIVNEVPSKKNILAPELPNHKGVDGWKIKSEDEYYKQYQESVFGLTYRKGGWDSLRHYEILMNGCIPLFLGLEFCPQDCIAFFPKDIVSGCISSYFNDVDSSGRMTLKKKLEESDIFDTISELLAWTRTYLTTEKMASYVLGVK